MDEAKEQARTVWGTGDYSHFSRQLEQASVELVRASGMGSGDSVLDVAAGDGNLALAAARAGARVVATDFSDVMVENGRRRTADAGVAVEWRAADAEDLPFDDDSFDYVTSVFGAMFAGAQEKAAAELFRTVRPGGTVATTAWTPEGQFGGLFEILDTYGPPSEPDEPDPLRWGTEDGVRALFPDASSIDFRRLDVTFSYPSWDAAVDTLEAHGVFVVLKRHMPPERYAALMGAVADLTRKHDRGAEGAVVYDAEYLEALVRK
ncbi:MAG TPA: methyltransferase domain-containing protein [Actinomycetota bacterium]|nr:methyltransferase domain-containing protein [Actinomycetota bacterium]